MASETHLTTEQLIALNFATNIVEPVKAYAKINTNKSNQQMKNLKKMGKHLAEAWSELKRLGVAVNETVMTTDGMTLEIDFADGSEIAVGQTVMIDGQPAPDGEYTLENGTMIMVAAGVITDIVPAEAVTTETVASLKNEIAKLKAELESAKGENTAMEMEVSEIVAHLRSLNTKYMPPRRTGAQVSTDIVKANANPSKEDIKARINQLRKK
jgi:hypothetical protein